MNLSTDSAVSKELFSALEYLEDMGICLSRDVRAVVRYGEAVFVKPFGSDNSAEYSANEDEISLLDNGASVVLSVSLPECKWDDKKLYDEIGYYSKLDYFRLSNGVISVGEKSPMKAAEKLVLLSSLVGEIYESLDIQERNTPDILSDFFGK